MWAHSGQVRWGVSATPSPAPGGEPPPPPISLTQKMTNYANVLVCPLFISDDEVESSRTDPCALFVTERPPPSKIWHNVFESARLQGGGGYWKRTYAVYESSPFKIQGCSTSGNLFYTVGGLQRQRGSEVIICSWGFFFHFTLKTFTEMMWI